MKKKLFALIFYSFFSVSALVYAESAYVIPSGMSAGIRLYTDGLSVAATQEVTDINGHTTSPAYSAGIRSGDIIFSASDIPLNTIEDLSDAVKANPEGLTLQVRHKNEAKEITVIPAQIADGDFRLGLWVRDSTAGIGTVTYFMSDNSTFAALGHGICDPDTGNILSVKSGNIQKCTNLSASKSIKGVPGEIDGSFDGEEIGELYVNTIAGVFGKLYNSFSPCGEIMKTALRSEIHEGSAYIMTDALGNGVECFSAEITKVKENSKDTKGLIIKITDERLINKTGGIVRGMSGSPIIQDNMLAGAITHVFVNDPSRGYGILAETMLESNQLVH